MQNTKALTIQKEAENNICKEITITLYSVESCNQFQHYLFFGENPWTILYSLMAITSRTFDSQNKGPEILSLLS
jgi:hypothetical protein